MNILGVTFSEFIQKGNVILGIVLAAIGVAGWLLAASITKAVRKTENIKNDDNILVGCKVASLISILAGMVLIALPL